MRLTLVIIFCITFFPCCKNEVTGITEIGDTLSYHADEWRGHALSLTDISCSGIVSEQHVLAEMIVHNSSDNVLHIFPASWELRTENGLSGIPASADPVQIQLQKNQSTKVIMRFEPVHDLKLFQQTSLRGDLNSKYILTIKFSTTDRGEEFIPLEFTIKPEILAMSVKTFGLASNTTPYIFSFDHYFPQQQKEHLITFFTDDSIHKEHNIQLSENEILINGLWMKATLYHKFDSLWINIRTVNKSGMPMRIDIAKITLQINGQLLSPIGYSTDALIKIPDGDRAVFSMKFCAPELPVYLLDLRAFESDRDHSVSVFSTPLKIIKYNREMQ